MKIIIQGGEKPSILSWWNTMHKYPKITKCGVSSDNMLLQKDKRNCQKVGMARKKFFKKFSSVTCFRSIISQSFVANCVKGSIKINAHCLLTTVITINKCHHSIASSSSDCHLHTTTITCHHMQSEIFVNIWKSMRCRFPYNENFVVFAKKNICGRKRESNNQLCLAK